MKKCMLIGIVILMILLHHDFWLWNDKTLLFEFLPIGLAYHLGYSALASLVMVILVLTAWPKRLEELDARAEEVDPEEPKQ